MNSEYLEFERPLAELDSKIVELKKLEHDANAASRVSEPASDEGANAPSLQDGANIGQAVQLDITEEVAKLEEKSKSLVRDIYKNLTPWQIAQVARHPRRPYFLDYLDLIVEEFIELKGDRAFGDDAAIIGGVARFDRQPVMVIGHQKGRSVPEKVNRNFGMPKPEGYRKALRLMKMAEQFGMPILTFIDTPGAFPGIDAEERGQSEAIATNIQEMTALKVPIIATVVGEGGSGGALAIGVCDHLQMLQYSTYSVISPEGCASILWKSADRAEEAAVAMGLTASRLKELELVDQVIEEPLGGAHRDYALIAERVKRALQDSLVKLLSQDVDSLLSRRYERLMQYSALA